MPKTSELSVRVNGRDFVFASETNILRPNAIRLCPAHSGGEIFVETSDGIFSSDAFTAAAYIYAKQKGEKTRCVVLMEGSGLSGIAPAVVEPDAGKVTLVLPTPSAARKADGAMYVTFPGIECVVSEREMKPEEHGHSMLFVLRDAKCEMLRVRFKPTESAAWIEIPGSGLAAAAAAIDLADSLTDGVIEYGIGMPGGTAEVGVSKRNSAVAGVSVCSVVSWKMTGESL